MTKALRNVADVIWSILALAGILLAVIVFMAALIIGTSPLNLLLNPHFGVIPLFLGWFAQGAGLILLLLVCGVTALDLCCRCVEYMSKQFPEEGRNRSH